MVYTGHALASAAAGGLVVRAPDGGLAVGEQHDRGGRLAAVDVPEPSPGRSSSTGRLPLGRLRSSASSMASSDVNTASPMAVPSPSCSRSIARATAAVFVGRRHELAGLLVEADEADLHARRARSSRNALGGVLGRGQARRA